MLNMSCALFPQHQQGSGSWLFYLTLRKASISAVFPCPDAGDPTRGSERAFHPAIGTPVRHLHQGTFRALRNLWWHKYFTCEQKKDLIRPWPPELKTTPLHAPLLLNPHPETYVLKLADSLPFSFVRLLRRGKLSLKPWCLNPLRCPWSSLWPPGRWMFLPGRKVGVHGDPKLSSTVLSLPQAQKRETRPFPGGLDAGLRVELHWTEGEDSPTFLPGLKPKFQG